jgi:ribosomal protein S18 acetylase RimI-like enzyme
MMDKQIEKNYPKNEGFHYLWLIGTKPEDQGKGYASALINEGLLKAEREGKRVYLETSTAPNLNFYNKKNFVKYGLFTLESLHSVSIHLLKWG